MWGGIFIYYFSMLISIATFVERVSEKVFLEQHSRVLDN